MTLYQAYLEGWNACLAGVDGRFWFTRPEQVEDEPSLRKAWMMGWNDCFEREEDDEEPCPEGWLSLEDFCKC